MFIGIDLPNELYALIDSYTDKRVQPFYTFHWICSYSSIRKFSKFLFQLPIYHARFNYHHTARKWCVVSFAEDPRGGWWYTGCIEPGLVVSYA